MKQSENVFFVGSLEFIEQTQHIQKQATHRNNTNTLKKKKKRQKMEPKSEFVHKTPSNDIQAIPIPTALRGAIQFKNETPLFHDMVPSFLQQPSMVESSNNNNKAFLSNFQAPQITEKMAIPSLPQAQKHIQIKCKDNNNNNNNNNYVPDITYPIQIKPEPAAETPISSHFTLTNQNTNNANNNSHKYNNNNSNHTQQKNSRNHKATQPIQSQTHTLPQTSNNHSIINHIPNPTFSLFFFFFKILFYFLDIV